MAREINLVPDIKGEMIKTLKLRNYIFFACLIVSIASVVVTLVFGLIAGGQLIARDSKNNTINDLSAKLNSYSELGDTLTIKDQVGNVNLLTEDKRVFSRTFSALAVMIPTSGDTIQISELKVDLGGSEDGEEQPTLTIEAQANAGKEPYYDYRVLEAFKKSLQYMRYDYGNYVDKEGNTIPAYCMIEQSGDGATLKEDRDGKSNYYAYWLIKGEGCNPSEKLTVNNYNVEEYEGQEVVKIWRTPQFDDWYKQNKIEGQPYMSLDGEISGVEHFESQCNVYSGDTSNGGTPKWDESNDCKLVEDKSGETPGYPDKIESSNGRNSAKELVLRFTMPIMMNPEYYKFSNTHMMAIPPIGRRNVTDSYSQVQIMFGERATDCGKDDADCQNADNGSVSSEEDNDESGSGSSSNNSSDNSSGNNAARESSVLDGGN